MRLSILLLFALVTGAQCGVLSLAKVIEYSFFPPTHVGDGIAFWRVENHIATFNQTIWLNDREDLFEMFATEEDDKEEIRQMSGIRQKFKIQPEHAVFDEHDKNKINAHVTLLEKHNDIHVPWILITNDNSPTGWKVTDNRFLRGVICEAATC